MTLLFATFHETYEESFVLNVKAMCWKGTAGLGVQFLGALAVTDL